MLPKIDELKNIAELSNALTQIDISESQLEDSILSSEIHIDNCNTLCCDRNRQVLFIIILISYNLKVNGVLLIRASFYLPQR